MTDLLRQAFGSRFSLLRSRLEQEFVEALNMLLVLDGQRLLLHLFGTVLERPAGIGAERYDSLPGRRRIVAEQPPHSLATANELLRSMSFSLEGILLRGARRSRPRSTPPVQALSRTLR